MGWKERLLGDRTARREAEDAAERAAREAQAAAARLGGNVPTTKQCPHCRATIDYEATTCPNCQQSIPR